MLLLAGREQDRRSPERDEQSGRSSRIPKIGPFDFSITNTVIYMWVSAVVVFAFFFIVAKRLKKEPDGLQTVAEILLDFATGHLTGQIGEKGKKYYYLILTLFSYIMVTNLIGLIPEAVALKPTTPTANINVTFGLASWSSPSPSTRGSTATGPASTWGPGWRHPACPKP